MGCIDGKPVPDAIQGRREISDELIRRYGPPEGGILQKRPFLGTIEDANYAEMAHPNEFMEMAVEGGRETLKRTAKRLGIVESMT